MIVLRYPWLPINTTTGVIVLRCDKEVGILLDLFTPSFAGNRDWSSPGIRVVRSVVISMVTEVKFLLVRFLGPHFFKQIPIH